MRCPHCSFEGEPIAGVCSRCGYRYASGSGGSRNPAITGIRPLSNTLSSRSGSLNLQSSPMRSRSGSLHSQSGSMHAIANPLRPLSLYMAKRGDTLNQGRYRLVDQLILPDNQQSQGAAWLAVDTSAGQTHVLIREIVIPPGGQDNRRQLVRAAVLRLSEVSQHPGFPRVLDVFGGPNNSFIVLQRIEGESLASLLRRQGGALPERTVAEYGRQLCEMLVLLSRQQPPIIHGSINPETVIVSPDRTRVSLLHLPFYPPQEMFVSGAIVGYKSPEQVRGDVDIDADLYAVAATMHHAVTGFNPRERVAFFYPPARRLNPMISSLLETILARELRLSASQRYTRASDMQKDLTTLLSTVDVDGEKKVVPTAGDTLRLNIAEARKHSRQRSIMQLSIFACACLVILLCALFFTGIYPLLRSSADGSLGATPNVTRVAATMANALRQEWQSEAAMYQKNQVALSDGRYVFDTYTGRASGEVAVKTQAAGALLSGDPGTALRDYDKAIAIDPADGEAQIYDENLQIKMRNEVYVTIVLGLPLNGELASLNVTRADLQAAFIFQHMMNTRNLLPDGLKLRILIGNSAGIDNGATMIAQDIAKRVQIGNLDHIAAVVGWPGTEDSSNASAVLANAKIPMVAQTASGVALDNLSPYFFRVSPDDATQGELQGKFAYQQLGARKVLVLRDPSDPYSVSLANAFISSFKQLGGTIIDNAADDFNEQATTVEQYEQYAVHDVMEKHADLIFMPGYDVDAIRLAHALGQMSNIYPLSLANVNILGGNAVDTALLLGDGTGPDAMLARDYSQDMQRLLFTSFSDVSEWDNVALAQRPAFFANWSLAYGVGTAPTNDALMTSDAFGVIVYALGLVKGSLTGESLRNALASVGMGEVRPYMGMSGPISFDSNGNPISKPIVLLQIAYDSSTGHNEILFVQASGRIR